MADIKGDDPIWAAADREFVLDRARLRFEHARKESIAHPEDKELYEDWVTAYRTLGEAKSDYERNAKK